MKLRQENYDGLLGFVTMCVKNYLDYCYPDRAFIAPMFATDLIDSRPTWKAADFVNLFKFMRQNPEKIFGTMDAEKLMSRVSLYEDARAAEVEKMYAENKGAQIKERISGDTSLKAVMGKEFERVQAERERTGQDVSYPKGIPDEKYFKEAKDLR